MLTLNFEGWFQCRLATDPDPSDELRGVSGWTLAVAGEEDLDRVIRLQEPVSRRSHGPGVGVVVRIVTVDERHIPGHPLVGGQVELLDGPKFEGRNGIVAEDAAEGIDPFHLRITSGGVTLRRKDILDPQNPERKIHEVDPSVLKRRQPVEGEAAERAEIADATGVMDYVGYRRERKEKLEADLGGGWSCVTGSSPKAHRRLEGEPREKGHQGGHPGSQPYLQVRDPRPRGSRW
jgi:hypothetical protein